MNARIAFAGLAAVGLVAAVGCSVKTTSNGGSGGSGSTSSTQVSTAVTSSTAVQATSTTSTSSTTDATSSGSGTFVAQCNPVTNEGCTAGQACDASNDGTFMCFDPPNDSGVCVKCDNKDGPFCKGGYGCAGKNGCAKYCCDDGDCGKGKCVKTNGNGDPQWPGVDVGVCLDDMGNAACDAPEAAPSAGKCVMVMK